MQDDDIPIEKRLDWGDDDGDDYELLPHSNCSTDSSNPMGDNSHVSTQQFDPNLSNTVVPNHQIKSNPTTSSETIDLDTGDNIPVDKSTFEANEGQAPQDIEEDEIVHENSTRFYPGQWIVFVGEGLAGLIISYNEEDGQYTVLAPPRFPKKQGKLMGESLPPPCLLSLEEAKQFSSCYPNDPVEVREDCAHPQCPHGENRDARRFWCTHAKNYIWRGVVFQHGLALYSLTSDAIEHSSATIDSLLFHLLIISQHPWVLARLFKMPLPSSWFFFKGEKVKVTLPCGASHTGSIVPDNWEGAIVRGEAQRCKVRFGNAFYFVPSISLLKLFEQGSTVDIAILGGTGTVLTVDYSTAMAIVAVDDETAAFLNSEKGFSETCVEKRINPTVFRFHINVLSSQHAPGPKISEMSFGMPSLRQKRPSLWVNMRIFVVAHPGKRGYKGTVRDVRPFPNNKSGLIVKVEYDIVNAYPSVEWVDYDLVRDERSRRFLHQANKQTGLDAYYVFSKSYNPTYSLAELMAIDGHEENTRLKAQHEKLVATDLKTFEKELRGLAVLPSPAPHQWIIDPRVWLSLHELEIYVQVHHGKWRTDHDDILVFLSFTFQKLEIRHYLSQRKKSGGEYAVISADDICDVPPNRVRTKSVPTYAADARGLYLIVDADSANKFHHIGKLVRCIRGVPSNQTSDGLFLCQRVDMIRVPGGKIRYSEQVVDEAPFELHSKHLVKVHLSQSLSNAGNQNMLEIRSRWKGDIHSSDSPQTRTRRKRKKYTALEDIPALERRIFEAGAGYPIQ